MRKLIRRLFSVAVLAALIFAGVRFGPNLYVRLFGNGNVQWVREHFSETLKEKNHLIVFEAELTEQQTFTQDAWLLGTVQKVVIPYSFQVSFSVDLSRASVTAEGTEIQVRVPSPEAGYQKLVVDEEKMQRNDWLYPLTPERYAEMKDALESQLFEEAKANPSYQENAWKNTVRDLESLFTSVVESGDLGGGFTVRVIQDDAVGLEEPEATTENAE